MNFVLAIISACQAYVKWVDWQREKELDHLEDEIDRLAADGSPIAQLRLERLAKRLKRKRDSTARPSDSDPPA